jgi:hypothetical protein
MRRSAALLLLAPIVLSGQISSLDEGRLDPTWFGPMVAFQPSKTLGFQWLKPGLDLRNRTLRLRGWEPTAWLLGKRALKDQSFLQRVESSLPQGLERGIRRGLKGTIPVSPTSGDLLLVARVVDAVGLADDYMAMGSVVLSFDIKLVDGDTGEVLGAFHDTLLGSNQESFSIQFDRWCENLGRALAPFSVPPMAVQPEGSKPVQTPPPAFDREGALRRIEGLKRDGLLSEEEYLSLRKKASEKVN